MAKYTKPATVNSSRRHPDKEQHAVVYDILSEGPVEGLANGFASVFINDVPFIDNIANEIMKPRRVILSTTAGSTDITHSQFGEINSLTLNNKSGLALGSRKVTIVGAEKQGAGIASMTAGSDTVTTSSSFFTADMVNSRSASPSTFIRIAGAGQDGADLITKVKTYVSATQITVQDTAVVTVSSKNISLDFNASISSISGNVATLSKAVPVTTSNVSCQISSLNTIIGQNDDIMNFEKVKMQFKSGERNQNYIPHETGFGSAATNTALNISLEQSDLRARVGTAGNLVSGYNNELDEPTQPEGTAEDTIITSALAGVSNPSEIDEIHLTFKLPGCHAIKTSSNSKESSFVELQIFFEYSVDNGSSYISELLYGPTNSQIMNRNTGRAGRNINFIADGAFPSTGYIKPYEPQYNEFSEEFMIITDKFQPYDDWRIRVRRINDQNFIDGSYRHTNPCTLSTIESIVKDKLKYPYTSYISTSFNAADFEGQLPQRAYLLKGLKIQVPTNYLTRDETGGAAAHTRNISTGAIESSYQNWDGNFRGDITTFNATSANYEKVYCNNPVWVFYDLLTNERYGLGQFIDKSNIDKYGLFQLAKYCDELVPDGEGGHEPRFTTNVYLSKAAEATNVLKQFASVFRGMAIWKDGEVTAIADREKEPVYAFTKGNIEGGIFQYEGTGDRVRTNQVKVQWNDPNDNYRQSTEYVEDQQGILETGRIVRSEHLAFGCTSRGQAHRAGKWKLLSQRLEKETVSFVTSIAATGLGPGDIITVQDADRDRSSYSGRVSGTGIKNTITIPLDRTISLPAYSSDFPPQLLLVYPKGGAYLEQETATISSTVYNRGDLIPSITSESSAANLTDDSSNSVQVFWSENVRIETKTVTTSAGNVSSLTVAPGFSEAPEEETIWSLRLFNSDGTEKTGTVKEYKIISIKEEDNYKYSIVAAEFAANKFAQIERGFELNVRSVDNSPNPEDVVPAPESISLSVEPMSMSDGSISTTTAADSQGHQLIVNWKFPEDSNGARYKFASGFEVAHNVRGEARNIKTNVTTQSLTFKNIKAGTYKIKVRTVSSSGTVSQYTIRQIEIAESSLGNPFVPKVDLVAKGGTINQTVTINSSSGLLEIGSNNYQFDSPSGETFLNSSSTASTYQQSFSGMGASAEAYLLFDESESTDRFKALQIHSDTSIAPVVTYFKEVGAPNNGLTTASGTIAVPANDNAIVGTSTSFESDFNNGDLIRIINGSSTTATSNGSIINSTALIISASNSNIKVGQKVTGTGITASVFVTTVSGNAVTLSSPQTIGSGVTLTFNPVTYYGRIQFIENDTLMYVDEVVKTVYSGASIKFQSFKPSILQDSILAKIVTNGSTAYSIEELYAVTKGITGGDGLSNALVTLYKTTNSNSESTLPSGNATYTFATGVLGSFATNANGWSQTITSVSAVNQYLWTTNAVASSTASTVVIADNAWATPKLLSTFGESGDNGLRTIQGYLFYEKTTSGAPSAPSGTTYTFSTGVVTGSGISTATNQPNNVWNNVPNTQDATSLNTFYSVRYYGTESSANSSTITVAYSNVVQQTSFTGVVTFSGGTLTDGTSSVDAIEAGDVAGNIGGVGVTTIDGGNIDTGSITADRIKLSGTGSLVISSFTNDSNFITSAGAPVQSVAGGTGTITTAELNAAGLRLTSDSVSTSLLSGTVGVSNGGTGRTTTASYVADLSAAGLRLTSDLVGVAQGGTGRTTTGSYVADLNAAGLRLTSDVVGEAQGGTGTTSFASALTAQGVGFVSGSNANLGALAILNNIDLSKVTDAGSLAALNSIGYNDATLTGTLDESNGGTGQTSDAAYASHLSSQGLIVTEVAGNTGAVTAATIISAGNILVADSNVTRDTNGGITSINGGVITTGTINSSVINTDTLAVKFFANESTKIYNHESPSVAVPLLRYGFNLRGTGGNTTYTGSNSSFVPVTITQVRNNASYSIVLAAVLGDVSGGKVQYSLNNSTWITASGGESNIYWSAGTYRGYTYTYQGTITNMTSSQNTVYWRVYFSGNYNHTHMQLHVTMDNTT